jgi:stage II sporulation protein D
MPARLQISRRVSAAVCALVALLACAAVLMAPATARADSIFAVSGRGWGHGIGMPQYGALGYAGQGRTYDWILAHFFQGTSIATRPELTVKVDLDVTQAARSAWRIAAASSSATLTVSDYTNGARSTEVARGATVWVTFSGGGTVLRADRYDSAAKKHVAGSVVATFPGSVVAATGPMAASMVRIIDPSGPFSGSSIAWRGQIRFTPHTTTGHAIDYVPMEQYLRGVVPRESPSSWPVEALRAQAVAARSYAYDAASSGSVLWCTTKSQVYGGALHGTSSHETARTDAAVADTAGEFVVFGSAVVTTYFSSSSGGRTANSKDVWFSSRADDVSPVYYTSVEGGESSTSPNYRWTLADMSGTALAGRIRAHYPSLAHPSPATVTTVTLEPGSSGFVRYIKLRWSKGADTTLTGPEFQHALGLKSSAFSVRLKNPPPPPLPPATRYQDSDAHLLWTGAWSVVKTASASGGTYRRASAAGAALTVMFQGTSASLVGVKSSHAGRADVYLDGTRRATVDLYDSSTHYKAALWTGAGLAADATHTLVVKVLGTHATRSGGSYVAIDAVDVAGTLLTVPRPPVWRRYEQTTATAKYSSGWKMSALAGSSGGTHAYSHVTSATVVFTFTGMRVRWIGKRAADYGKAWVSVDSSAAVLVDLYSAKALFQQRVFESPLLALGTHTLTIRVAGTKNAKATYHYVDVDAFEALQPAR